MVPGDGPRAFAGGARGQHVVAVPHAVGGGAGDARKRRDVVDADGDDGVDDAGPVHRRQHDGREDGRKRKAEVRHAHDRFFDPAAFGRGQQAERRAHDEADADGDDADQNRRPRAHQQQRHHVAPKRIGAQPVLRAGRQQLGVHVDFVDGVGRPHIRQRRGQQQQQRQHAADDEARVPARALPETGGGARAGGGQGGAVHACRFKKKCLQRLLNRRKQL